MIVMCVAYAICIIAVLVKFRNVVINRTISFSVGIAIPLVRMLIATGLTNVL